MTSNNGDKPPPQSRKGKITGLLSAIEEMVTTKDGKPTIGDYVRLVHLERELDEGQTLQPGTLKVTWIEQSEKTVFEE